MRILSIFLDALLPRVYIRLEVDLDFLLVAACVANRLLCKKDADYCRSRSSCSSSSRTCSLDWAIRLRCALFHLYKPPLAGS